MKRILILAILFLSANALTAAPAWQPAGEHIRTRWAAEVGPKNVLPEYPRPQMIRGSWKNLNGLWDYAVTPDDVAEMPVPAGEILVPFALESSLSGVGERLNPQDALWYRRAFRVPLLWRLRKTVLLHFGAVDYINTDRDVYLFAVSNTGRGMSYVQVLPQALLSVIFEEEATSVS